MVSIAAMQLFPTPSKSVQLYFSYFDILWFDILRVSCKGGMWSNYMFKITLAALMEDGDGS